MGNFEEAQIMGIILAPYYAEAMSGEKQDLPDWYPTIEQVKAMTEEEKYEMCDKIQEWRAEEMEKVLGGTLLGQRLSAHLKKQGNLPDKSEE